MPSDSARPLGGKTTGWPSSTTVPEVGCSMPERILMRVDLPAPFSPMMACTSPRFTSKSTLNSTGTSLNDLEMRLAARIAGALTPTASDMLFLPEAARFHP